MKPTFNVREQSEIYIGPTADILSGVLPEGRVIVVSDATIDRLYHPLLAPYDTVLIGAGESIKTLQTVESIYRRFIELGADRSTFVLAVGGGIVTDVAGFAAATYMRGLSFGFVSTTLLGQVDASVGGKNGVNVDGYKNMAGTFKQPRFVICDPEMLRTLSDREFRTGLPRSSRRPSSPTPIFSPGSKTSLSRPCAPIPTCLRTLFPPRSASRPILSNATSTRRATAASSTWGIRWPTPSRSARTG